MNDSTTSSTVADGPGTAGAPAGAPARGLDGVRPLTDRATGWLLLVLGGLGFLASLRLTIERFHVLSDPSYRPSCSLNVLVDCGAAMESWQGRLLGFPNPVIGVAAFAVVATVGVVVLTGARLPRWFWVALLAGTTVGAGLVVFLMWTSFYALVALCLYCMAVWTVMIPLFWFQVVRGVQEGYLPAGDGLRRVVVGNRGLVLVLLYVVAVAWLLLAIGSELAASFGL